ncbi:MAG TPA: hypothetical protein VJ911_05160 [Cryomorphaceae bacterium]|nr:hypothetical protein [Cryomorphaceae bacterium]
MKLSDKKGWIPLLAAIPFVFIYLWMETGPLGTTEIVIATTSILAVFGIVFLVNRNSGKK